MADLGPSDVRHGMPNMQEMGGITMGGGRGRKNLTYPFNNPGSCSDLPTASVSTISTDNKFLFMTM